MALESVLARIPGVAGYSAGQEQDSVAQMGQLQQVGALQGILAKVKAEQQDTQYRGALAEAKTPEEQYAVAVKYGGPAAVMQSMDRRTTADQTKQLAMSRLSAQLQRDAADLAHKARTATTAEEKFHWQQQMDTLKATAQKQAAEIAAGRYTYDTGNAIAPFQGAVPVAAPAQGGTVLQGSAPTEAAGLAQFAAGGGAPRRVDITGAPPQGVLAYPSGPTPPPVAPLTPQPAADEQGAPPAFRGFSGYIPPQNPDTELRRLGGGQIDPRAAPVAAAAATPSTPSAPAATSKPPEYASWPQRKKDEFDARQWISNARTGTGSNAPISPETATRIAQQALAGDMSGLASFGRNLAARAQIEEAITRIGNETGKTGGDLAGNKAMNAANRVALTAVTKDLAAITPFKEMLDTNAKVAMDLGRKITDDKTNSALVNKPLLWVKNNLSNRPDIAEYLAQMHFVEVEAARVLTQPRLVGQLTDQAIKDMKSVLDGSMTIGSTEAVLNRILADGNNRINAMKSQQQRTLAEIKGTPARTRSTDRVGVDTRNPLLR